MIGLWEGGEANCFIMLIILIRWNERAETRRAAKNGPPSTVIIFFLFTNRKKPRIIMTSELPAARRHELTALIWDYFGGTSGIYFC